MRCQRKSASVSVLTSLIAIVDHAYSHFRIRLHAFRCTYVSGTPQCLACDDIKWVWPRDLGRYAFPAANNKIIQALRERGSPMKP